MSIPGQIADKSLAIGSASAASDRRHFAVDHPVTQEASIVFVRRWFVL